MQKPSKGLLVPSFKWLEPEDFEFLCFDLARELMTFKEPIPDYPTRDNGLLESALANPKQVFGGNLLYPTLTSQASILFYSLIKNHPFRNGNKRIAVMALLTHLSINGKWINIKPLDLYELACKISESNRNDKDEMLMLIENGVSKNLVEFPRK